MLLRKHGVKIFFVIACFLTALSLILSAYSYARYVTSENTGMDGAGIAGVDCELTMQNGGGSSFVNAPFVQKISDNTQPVQMNSWAEAQVTVRNNGPKNGLKYEYSFVLYMPQGFAERAMFQFAELKDPNDARDEEDGGARLADAKKASEIYILDPSSLKLVQADKTNQGITIENDYRSLIADGGELKIETDAPCAVLLGETRTVSEKSTYSTYRLENGSLHFVAPVSYTRQAEMRFYRITVNFSYTENTQEYVLSGGDAKSFLFRLVLKESLDSDKFSDSVFDPSVLWVTTEGEDGKLSYVRPLDGELGLPQTDEKFECRWATQITDGTESYVFDNEGKPVLQIKAKNESEESWQSITYGARVGLTSPTKITAVFTQCDGFSA